MSEPSFHEVTPSLSRPIRLLMVGNFFSSPRIGFQYCSALADQLEKRGHAVVRTSFSAHRALRLVDMLRSSWMGRERFDFAHIDVFSGPAFEWARLVGAFLRALGKPYVLTLHGGSLPEFAEQRPRAVTRLLRSARVVTAPSLYLCDALQSIRRDIRFVPNAIELSDYPYRRRSPLLPDLIWLRAFHRIYAPETAVLAFKTVLEQYPSARLRMVGPDKDGSLAISRDLAHELDLGKASEFVPGIPKKEVPRELSTNSIFINTTTIDNTPMSVMEAMACGLPVVTSDVGGIRYLLADGVDAAFVPARDPVRLAEAILGLLREPGFAVSIAERARQKVERFDWRYVLPAWEQLFAEVLSKRDGPHIK